MARLGRYSSDRKKYESITADKTVVAAECGTIFVLNVASGCTVTLPSVASAGQGWWCKFFVGTNCSLNTYVITENTGADTDVLVTQINELETDNTEDGPSNTGHTTITIANALDTVGDFIEVLCDGTNFYCHGQSVLDGAMTPA